MLQITNVPFSGDGQKTPYSRDHSKPGAKLDLVKKFLAYCKNILQCIYTT